MQFEPLCIGIKRGEFRANDAHAKQADVVFDARRDAALRKQSYRCVRCGYESAESSKQKKRSNLHVHHKDNDHHNNEPDNYEPHCSLDHAYHHIGCDAPTPGGSKGWASQMRMGFAPELSAEDMNHLQRACGAALGNEKERAIALEVIGLLGVLAMPVNEVFNSFHAKDFAACFAKMDEAEYEQRHEHVEGLRLLFHPDILKMVGAEMLQDSPLFPVKSWEGVADGLGIS